jgi:hypothetical protein
VVSAYRRAIDQTTDTIAHRARCYRNLVIGVVLTGMVSIGGALWLRSLYALSCLLLLIPFCGLFYYVDARLVLSWRTKLLENWALGEIDFFAFLEALRAIPSLPGETLSAMLKGLPLSGTLASEQSIPLQTRKALAAVDRSIHAYRVDLLGFRAAAWTIVVAAAIVATLVRSWYPLSGGSVVLLFPLLAALSERFRSRDAKEKVYATRLDPSSSYVAFERLALRLDWTPISAARRDFFITAVRSKAREDNPGADGLRTSRPPLA